MTEIQLTLALPDRLAKNAREAGLLSARGVARLLREELRRQADRRNRRAAPNKRSIVELLAGDPDIEFDPPRLGEGGVGWHLADREGQ